MVLLTVLSNVTDVIRALEVMADYFLTKPYQEGELLAKVASILQWHPLQREMDSERGLNLAVGDERRVIYASRRQMLNLLLSGYEDAIQKNRDLSGVREELDGHRRHLEELVEARTRELEERAEQLKRTHAALEQAKDRERRERELRSLATLSSPPQTGVTAKMYGTMTLMEGFPDTFRHLVDGYKALMDLALDQPAFKVKHDISGRLSSMAESLGFYKAGPRDIVDIHTTALKEKARETATAEKKKAYTGEGWIMVLELMGHLVSFCGKKKTHTVKNNILANSNCEIIFLTPTVEGKKHDKRIADESEYSLPEGSILLQDTGFQGFSVSKVEILQPTKKPRGKELTQEQKDRNRNISKIRVRIEHVINGVKRYRIVKDKFRNWVRGFNDLVIGIACGLHNLRLRFRPWKEVKIHDV